MKEIAVIFDRPVILPGEDMVPLKSFGYIHSKSDLEKNENNRVYITDQEYVKNYLLVIAELFRDKYVEFVEKRYFKKKGKVFFEGDRIWKKYEKKAKKVSVQFAILEIENTDVPNEDRDDDYLLISKERWDSLKSRDDVVWEQ